MGRPVRKKRSTPKKLSQKNSTAKNQGPRYLTVHARLFAPERPRIFKYFFPPEPFKPRRVLSIHDLTMMLGCSSATARRQIVKIYKWRRKPPRPYVSVKSFCKYHQIDEQDVQDFFMSIHNLKFMEAIHKRRKF